MGIRTLRRLLLLIMAGVAGGVTHPPTAHAIVINDDAFSITDSRTLAAPFDAIVQVSSSGGTGSGILISPTTILTARHVTEGVSAAGFSVRFGDKVTSPYTPDAFTRSVSAKWEAGSGGTYNGTDVAMLTLSTPVTTITPMRLVDYTTEAIGQVGYMLGIGYNGTGDVGHENNRDGYRWYGENIIESYGMRAGTTGFSGSTANIFSTDFDDGTAAANEMDWFGSSATPLTRESTTAPGDSGGPLLVQLNSELFIIGVLSGGTTANSVYGDISWWTGISPYRSNIELAGGEFFDLEAVPEPSTIVLFGSGFLMLWWRRRSSR